MKVLFVRPDSIAVSCPPPLGLGYLSHALKASRGDETMVIDGRKSRLNPEEILQYVDDLQPDAVGVTSMTIEAPQATTLISRIKSKWPGIPVIIGGAHITACGASVLESIQADYAVFGEGEDTIVDLLNALEADGDLSQVKGIAFRNGRDILVSESRPFIEEIDRLKIDWDAIHPDDYFGFWSRNGFHTIAKSGRRMPVFTSRGCPMGCSYCHNIFGRKFRTFDVSSKVDEMIMLRDKYQVEEFEFHDDFFNLDLERAKAFLRETMDRKLGCALAFPNGFRADRMDEELLDLLVAAGTYQVTYAIESASERIQKLVHKKLNLERAREVVNMTAARRVVTGAYYILGFPEETEDEMIGTIDYAVSLKNHISHFFHLMPFPGTEIAETNTEISEKVRKMDFGAYFDVVFNLSSVPDDTLARMRQMAYRRFYFSPIRVGRIIRDIPKNPRLLRSMAIARLSFMQSKRD